MKEEQKIIHIASELIGVDLTTGFTRRKREYVTGRYLVFYVLIRRLQYGVEKAAAVFEKDHSTALYGVSKIDDLVSTDKEFALKFRYLLHYKDKSVYAPSTEEMYKSLYSDKPQTHSKEDMIRFAEYVRDNKLL